MRVLKGNWVEELLLEDLVKKNTSKISGDNHHGIDERVSVTKDDFKPPVLSQEQKLWRRAGGKIEESQRSKGTRRALIEEKLWNQAKMELASEEQNKISSQRAQWKLLYGHQKLKNKEIMKLNDELVREYDTPISIWKQQKESNLIYTSSAKKEGFGRRTDFSKEIKEKLVNEWQPNF